MTTYVFLGPSLPVAEATAILEATYLPPIEQGDLLRLLTCRPAQVGIVDGYFDTVPSVWHKEILIAIREGVRVFGAASMGALRAAELHPFGMTGVGTIFEWYRDDVITADDEVAVLHAPAELGYQALTEPLVDIRDRCASAVRDHIISEPLAAQLIAAAKALPYQNRSCAAAAAKARANGSCPAELDAWLDHAKTGGPGLKARDTRQLLVAMKDSGRREQTASTVEFAVERTTFIEQLRNDIAFESVAGRSLSSCSNGTALRAGETLAGLRKHVCLRIVARLAAQQLGWSLTVEEVDEYAERFREAFGLTDPEAMRRWMDAEKVSEDIFWQFVNESLFIERFEHLHAMEIENGVVDQLRLMTAREHL
jgi:hypothetical protein